MNLRPPKTVAKPSQDQEKRGWTKKEKKIDKEAKCEGLRGQYKVLLSFLILASLWKTTFQIKKKRVIIWGISSNTKGLLKVFFYSFLFYINVYKHKKKGSKCLTNDIAFISLLLWFLFNEVILMFLIY
jgi:hypothetical protein